MRKIMLPIGMLALVFLAACAPLFGPQPTPTAAIAKLPALEGNWQLELSQSGGIMGMSRWLVVSSDGRVTAEDDRTQASATDTLTPEAMALLKRLAAEATYPTILPASACADCFYFRLEISGVSHPMDVQLDEITLLDSGLYPLVGLLHDEMVRLLGN